MRNWDRRIKFWNLLLRKAMGVSSWIKASAKRKLLYVLINEVEKEIKGELFRPLFGKRPRIVRDDNPDPIGDALILDPICEWKITPDEKNEIGATKEFYLIMAGLVSRTIPYELCLLSWDFEARKRYLSGCIRSDTNEFTEKGLKELIAEFQKKVKEIREEKEDEQEEVSLPLK